MDQQYGGFNTNRDPSQNSPYLNPAAMNQTGGFRPTDPAFQQAGNPAGSYPGQPLYGAQNGASSWQSPYGTGRYGNLSMPQDSGAAGQPPFGSGSYGYQNMQQAGQPAQQRPSFLQNMQEQVRQPVSGDSNSQTGNTIRSALMENRNVKKTKAFLDWFINVPAVRKIGDVLRAKRWLIILILAGLIVLPYLIMVVIGFVSTIVQSISIPYYLKEFIVIFLTTILYALLGCILNGSGTAAMAFAGKKRTLALILMGVQMLFTALLTAILGINRTVPVLNAVNIFLFLQEGILLTTIILGKNPYDVAVSVVQAFFCLIVLILSIIALATGSRWILPRGVNVLQTPALLVLLFMIIGDIFLSISMVFVSLSRDAATEKGIFGKQAGRNKPRTGFDAAGQTRAAGISANAASAAAPAMTRNQSAYPGGNASAMPAAAPAMTRNQSAYPGGNANPAPVEDSAFEEQIRKFYKPSLAKTMLLTIVTLGIYGLVFRLRIIRFTRIARGRSKNPVGEFLRFLFVPFYSVHWSRSRAKSVPAALRAKGYAAPDFHGAALLWSLGVISVDVVFYVFQLMINSVVEQIDLKRNNGAVPNLDPQPSPTPSPVPSATPTAELPRFMQQPFTPQTQNNPGSAAAVPYAQTTAETPSAAWNMPGPAASPAVPDFIASSKPAFPEIEAPSENGQPASRRRRSAP